ncbi:Rpp20 subunit of nuclear RNase MRP and P-domain-containing protein [Ampelomyces quisqualis]|uniref:Rpp20 subunit of nuclear RNase MRP and P-domain-containing protein n=1 Tax=Ampelomyces quisqualis TaxID=50730 RepID=A0A6A5QI30_AMPQU|nr:Rpp20 subunit of nuclear RNase MRP and P-domain-containing protein [Ampelomyces quisqualis]
MTANDATPLLMRRTLSHLATKAMAGQKRTRDGQVKSTDATAQAAIEPPIADPTPPCSQPQLPCSKSSSAQTPTQETAQTKHPKPTNATASTHPKPAPSNPTHQKLPRLPPNTKICKRPLLHPSPAPPFSSALSPKTIYITPSTPFVPALKRIRALLAQIAHREEDAALQPLYGNKARSAGALSNRLVERHIADACVGGGKEGGREKVFLKASGRAIPRALEVGVEMQAEGCGVRVEMGSVRAVDDVEIVAGVEAGDEDIPETRLRNVSCVTVSIWAK